MRLFLLFLLLSLAGPCYAASDSLRHRVLIIPYQEAMHLSDADPDISMGSELDLGEMRKTFRLGLLKSIKERTAEISDTRLLESDFVAEDVDQDRLYKAIYYTEDTVYRKTKLLPADSTIAANTKPLSKKGAKQPEPTSYMNVGFHDQLLLKDLGRNFGVDRIVLLNEVDIITHTDDCLDLALQIYRRELKVHFSVFTSSGKQVYGGVAHADFPSNSNDVQEILKRVAPSIADQVRRGANAPATETP